MADYSRYGIPSSQWAECIQDNSNDVFLRGFVPDIASRPIKYIEELQHVANRNQIAAAHEHCDRMGWTETIKKRDVQIGSRSGGTIPLRLYKHQSRETSEEPLPIYLYFHGGGYMFGTLDGEDANCSYVANELPVVVINVCYRHTPHHKFPTQREDCLDSFVWTIANASSFGGDPNRIVLGGISAGGGLCAWLTLTEHQRPPDDPLAGQSKRIKGQVLGIPWLLQPSTFPHHLIKSPEISSHVQCKEAPVLPMSKLAFFELSLADPNATDDFVDLGDAAIERLKGLPKTTILVAGMDVLRDEGMLYAENLKRAGVPTHVHMFKGLPHGFRRYQHLPAAAKWNEATKNAIQWALETGEDVGASHWLFLES